MTDPLFWLGLSLLLVAISLAVVLMAALPALRELGRAARSLKNLCETLDRELPPMLEAIRRTGLELSELTDDVSDSVQQVGQVVKQVDTSIEGARRQAQHIQVSTRSLFAGVRAAWHTWTKPKPTKSKRPRSRASALHPPHGSSARSMNRYPASGPEDSTQSSRNIIHIPSASQTQPTAAPHDLDPTPAAAPPEPSTGLTSDDSAIPPI